MHELHGPPRPPLPLEKRTSRRKPRWSAAAHVVFRFRCLTQLTLQAAIFKMSPRSVTRLGGKH